MDEIYNFVPEFGIIYGIRVKKDNKIYYIGSSYKHNQREKVHNSNINNGSDVLYIYKYFRENNIRREKDYEFITLQTIPNVLRLFGKHFKQFLVNYEKIQIELYKPICNKVHNPLYLITDKQKRQHKYNENYRKTFNLKTFYCRACKKSVLLCYESLHYISAYHIRNVQEIEDEKTLRQLRIDKVVNKNIHSMDHIVVAMDDDTIYLDNGLICLDI
jgi:hypothetical protein